MDNQITLEQQLGIRGYLRKIFMYMGMALFISAVTAYLSIDTGLFYLFLVATNFYGHIILLFAQIGLVFFISRRIAESSYKTLLTLFIVYSVLTGFTLSIYLLMYEMYYIFLAFGLTSLLFVNLAIIGYTTKMDLTKYSTILFGGLITLIIVTLVNNFLRIDTLTTIINYVGVIIFMGITAYDVQKVKAGYLEIENNQELLDKFTIYWSLNLYLDFINMFLYILRIVGKKK